MPFERSTSLVEDVIDDLATDMEHLATQDTLLEHRDVNLYEMRVPIGTIYDTSDISVQLEGSKVLVHCHTIEPTDKRGNYRKHEFKTELFVPDTVDDETVIAYLTEQGELIVEGKYHLWAWKDIQRQEKQTTKMKKKKKKKKKKQDTQVCHSSTVIQPDEAGRMK
jgi:hypothetical protein